MSVVRRLDLPKSLALLHAADFHRRLPRPAYARALRTAGVAFLLFLAGAVAGEEAAQRPSHLLLVTVDTLRPDALGWVAGRHPTPAIDALAGAGYRFKAAMAPAPVTQPVHASLFTGLIPRRHGVRDNGQVLGSAPATLAEHLRRAGYTTAAFVSGYPLAAGFGLERGFEYYDDQLAAGVPGRLERPASETTRAALDWLAGAVPEAGSAAAKPRFLWVHYWDPHDPYTPPAEFARSGPRGAYLGEVAYVDHAIGELLRGLRQRLTGDLLTVFAADHGESLGEHGEQTHGFFVYQSTVAVPLVFHLPGRVVAAESGAAARLIDVAPTVLELLDQPPLPGDLDGVSLAVLLAGSEQEPPAAYLESRRPWLSYGWAPLRAVRQGRWKLIAAPEPELYDLARDPGETTNLFGRERAKARQLVALLRRAEARPAVASSAAADPSALARLEALGYAGAGATAGEPPPDAADPKARVELWNALSRATELLERGHHAAAVAAFDAVLKQEPDNPFALSRSGAALLQTRDFAAAARRLERAARLRPEDTETRSALAGALNRVGRDADAAEHWVELARLQPERVDAWVGLATSLGRSGKPGEAVDALAHAVELAAERVDLRIQLAFIQHSMGNTAEAIRHLSLAAERMGPETFPHAGALGLLLARAGRVQEAAVWLGRSRPGDGDFAEARFELARLQAAADPDAARRELTLALGADPRLRARAEAEPLLDGLLP